MHSLALPIFTLFVQSAVGIATVLLLIQSSTARALKWQGETAVLFVACGLTALGLMASMTHIGYPQNALYSLTHFTSSWLSREIVLSSAFLAFAGITFLLSFKQKSINTIVLSIAILCGLADIFSMGSIYRASSVATWQSVHTLTSFFGVMITAGCLVGMGLVGCVANFTDKHKQAIKCLSVCLIVMLIIRGFTQTDMLVNLPHDVTALGMMFPSQSQIPFMHNEGWLFAGWVLAVIGALSLIINLMRSEPRLSKFYGLAVICLVGFEIISRFNFYSIAA